MEKILVDVGNTALKFAWYDDQKLKKQVILNSNKMISAKKILKILRKKQINFQKIALLALSSVKPIWDKKIKKIANMLHITFYQIKSNLQVKDFVIKYDDPNKIGADLLMSAYAGFKKYPHRDLIIISFGTATTISLIRNNVLEGTIIMPGLKISGEALFKSAALLHTFPYDISNLIIGKNTEDAINIGLVNGHLLAIKGLIDNLRPNVKNPLCLIMGNNNYHYEHFFKNYKLEPYLVFEGINFVLAQNILDFKNSDSKKN